jgi:hypothetical protein
MKRRWPLALALTLLLALAAVLLAWGAISALNPMPLSITVDDERIVENLDLAAMAPEARILLAGVLAFVLLSALIVVPMALLLTLLGLLVAALAVVGLPLLVALALMGLLLSPLLLIGWLVWKMLAPS